MVLDASLLHSLEKQLSLRSAHTRLLLLLLAIVVAFLIFRAVVGPLRVDSNTRTLCVTAPVSMCLYHETCYDR